MEKLHQSGDIIADKYRIIDVLGEGSNGTTYRAENLQNSQLVAIKALSLQQLTDWKMLELFEREVKILSQLNHPGIPSYLEYFEIDTEDNRNFYIVQKLAEGKSLAAWVESSWRTDEAGVQKIASQLLEILIYLHELEPPVIHRDIKPQNIIRREDGQLFLVDFGAVTDTYYNTLVRGSTVVGTYGYMAPEQFKGQAVPTTDLYGLGATLLFLLTHRSPAGLPTDQLKIDFRSRVQISEQFADWLEKMLEPDVEDRFSSAKEALDVLSGQQVIDNNSADTIQSKLFNKFTITAFALFSFTIVSSVLISIFPWDSSPEGMCKAIHKKKTMTVKIYLALGGDPKADLGLVPRFLGERTTLLDCVEKFGKKEIAELLIAEITKGADINARDKNGETLLHFAAGYDRKDLAEKLIAKGADVNAKNNNSDTPLHQAAVSKRLLVAEMLIAKGADVNVKNKNGDTPLHWAADNNSKDVADLLIAKGADINARNNDGNTPLLLAAGNRGVPTRRVLTIDEVADSSVPIVIMETRIVCSFLLVESGNSEKRRIISEELQIILDRSNCNTTPYEVGTGNSKEVAELLIAKGADVNAKNNYGDTPIIIANARSNTENAKKIVELLKSHGAKE